jgi:hypothetical protein
MVNFSLYNRIFINRGYLCLRNCESDFCLGKCRYYIIFFRKLIEFRNRIRLI